MHEPDEVFNQPAPLVGGNRFRSHPALRQALDRWWPGLDTSGLEVLGADVAAAAWQHQAVLAHRHTPRLVTHDTVGRRVDRVEFHPAYHALLQRALAAGLHGTAWAGESGGHVLRAAGFLLFTELEASVTCPVSMTYAATPALRGQGDWTQAWLAGVADRRYDAAEAPIAQKTALTLGMGMTERQGGSDVRSNTTRATPQGRDAAGRAVYALRGHKWFFSAPMCDGHLVLAQAPGGLTCLLLPHWLDDGTRNAVRLERLKDKLGNRANASAEVTFDDAIAWRLGEEGEGVAQILRMGALTRLDCALGSAGLMRHAVSLALHHCRQRWAFGAPLVDQPAMAAVLADLALESEAAMALALRLAVAVQRSEAGDEAETALRRVLTPVAKYWVCKRGAVLAQEAMECLGGNGYVEADAEGVMARIYREMPVNSIWEGAGNIQALDLLRALREARCVEALEALWQTVPRFDAERAALLAALASEAGVADARGLAGRIALLTQAVLLVQYAPDEVVDAFAPRLAQGAPAVFGEHGLVVPAQPLLARALAPSPSGRGQG
jgi:putative acyl-CoA dehydrogenase